MTQNENDRDVQMVSGLLYDEQKLMARTIDSLFEVETEEALQLIDGKLRELEQQSGGDEVSTLPGVLKYLRNFFRAILLAQNQMDFTEAQVLFEQAAGAFDQLGQEELKALSLGFRYNVEAFLEIHKANVTLALDLITKSKKHIQSAGRFGELYEPMINLMERDALAISALRAMMSLDYPSAKILFEQASQAAENVAHKYFEESTPGYNTHQGIAHYYRALSTFTQAYNRLNQLRYDEVANQKNLLHDAVQARELLSKGDGKDVSVRRLAYVSDAFANLLEVTFDLAQFMEKVFRSTVKPDIEAFEAMRKKIQTASDLFAKAGQDAVSFVRFCDELNSRISNIERLTKPSKKDFGKFSGIVASASFLPLFLVTSWVNSTFGVGVKASTIIWYCLGLSLISGFGFGALRFKSLFSASNEPSN